MVRTGYSKRNMQMVVHVVRHLQNLVGGDGFQIRKRILMCGFDYGSMEFIGTQISSIPKGLQPEIHRLNNLAERAKSLFSDRFKDGW